jgi:putative membrane protein
MLWVKAFHIVAMVAWMAGIFYLPRLFVYHAMCPPDDDVGRARFHVMERKLYRGIMTPSMIVTIALGSWLIVMYGMDFLRLSTWLHVKLILVAILVGYHLWCGRVMRAFALDANTRSHKFYRVFNELPVFLLIGIVVLVIVKPF